MTRAKKTAKGFLVRFMVQTATEYVEWEERIEYPVSDDKIAKAVRLAKLLPSNDIRARNTSFYGGIILDRAYRCGDYLIDPRSEIR